DRTAIKSQDITFENIWGVADEDLFRLTIGELDKRWAAHKPFYAHVMTVSNHRPFAYPAGRIDIPPGTREGAVKYTDFAIGQFIDRASERPWFAHTLFAIVADHTHKGRGRTELPPENYHIPLIVYSPGQVKPGRVDAVSSQIDVGPTLLGLLGFSYRSRFFGHDILEDKGRHQRALFANYQTVGYYRDGIVVELKPKGRYRVVDAETGRGGGGGPRAATVVHRRGERGRSALAAVAQRGDQLLPGGEQRIPQRGAEAGRPGRSRALIQESNFLKRTGAATPATNSPSAM